MEKAEVKLTEYSEVIHGYTADFVGRRWLVEQVDQLLALGDCRFVVLTGAAGVGKSAFMAHLAQTHEHYPRYFIRRDSWQILRPGDAKTFLLTIGGQLATLYPHLFKPENLEVIIRQRVGDLEAGGEAVGVQIQELYTSPFYRVALRVEQEIDRVAGKATGLEIGRLIADPRNLEMQDLLYMGLIDPAWWLYQTDPGAQIVVLVDALDELRFRPVEGKNVLDVLCELPVDMNDAAEKPEDHPNRKMTGVPPNIRFVVTSRKEDLLAELLGRDDVRELPLALIDENNQKDLRDYLRKNLPQDGLAQALEKVESTPHKFQQDLLRKANGNFLYLRSILETLREALADTQKRKELLPSLLKVDMLPGQLDQLYDYFIDKIVKTIIAPQFGASAWREYLRPFLGILAVAQEPLRVAQLEAFTGLNSEDISDLLRELRQFVEPVGAPPSFHIYHTSFAEYLLDDQSNQDYQINARKWHTRIADYYWEEGHPDWGRLGDQHDNGYGLNNLGFHLYKNQDDRLPMLISKKWMLARHAGRDYAGFVADVDLAWQAAQAQREPNLLHLARLGMARCSVREDAGLYSDFELKTLVWLNHQNKALNLARLRNDPVRRSNGLLTIYRALQAQGKDDPNVLDEAYRVVLAFEGKGSSQDLVSALAQSNQYDRAFECVDYLQDASGKAAALFEVTASLAEAGEHDRALEVAQTISDTSVRSAALVRLAAILIRAEKEFQALETLRQVLALKDADDHNPIRNDPLSVLPGSELEQSDELIKLSLQVGDDSVGWLGELAAALVNVGDPRGTLLFGMATQFANSIPDELELQPMAICDLAGNLARAEQIEEAIQMACSIQPEWARSRGLRRVGGHLSTTRGALSSELCVKLLECASSITDLPLRYDTFCDLVTGIPPTCRIQARDVLKMEIENVRLIQDNYQKKEALGYLAGAMAYVGNDEAEQVFSELLDLARATKPSGRYLYDRRRAVVKVLAENRFYAEAEEVARLIWGNPSKSAALLTVAVSLLQAGDPHGEQLFSEVEKMAGKRQPEPEDWKEKLRMRGVDRQLKRIRFELSLRRLETMIQAGQWSAAEQLIESDTTGWVEVMARRWYAVALVKSGHPEAEMAITRAIDAARRNYENEDELAPLCQLAIDLAQIGDQHAAIVLDEADRLSMDELDRAEVSRARAVCLAQMGDSPASGAFHQAYAAINAIPDRLAELRAELLCKLAGDMAQNEHDEAERVFEEVFESVRALREGPNRARLLGELASIQARAGNFPRAFNTLDPRQPVDEYIEFMAKWAPFFEQKKAGLSLTVLREATGVAGWLWSSWHDIHQVLCKVKPVE